MDERNRRYHEVANLFPLMQGEEYEALKADIAENGQREPIWLHSDGSIIDGRNRHRACVELDIAPRFETWNGNGSLVSFVVSLNLHRRHLSASQRAAIAPDIKRRLADEIAIEKAEKNRVHALQREAQKRQEQTAASGQREFITDAPQEYEVDAPEEIEQVRPLMDEPARDSGKEAASVLGVGRSYVYEAERLEREAPDLLEEVKNGAKSITQAKRELTKRTMPPAPALPSNKYRVWYADPPWHYGNSGVISDGDNYGRAERHYPTMTIAELCAMGDQIKEACEPNAVLFMWVTSPLLDECFPVIKAWGFEYKTSFVWDKVGHNFGHYNSVRHEFLLVCTRGSCTPDSPKLHDSVISIEKSRTHSEKPERFREIIDLLYPGGNRIELFSRRKVSGWDAWGNQA